MVTIHDQYKNRINKMVSPNARLDDLDARSQWVGKGKQVGKPYKRLQSQGHVKTKKPTVAAT